MKESLPTGTPENYLTIALDIGEQLLLSGAEIARCEDTIERICRAYGFVSVHVFTVTAGIIVTVFDASGASLTQLRRVRTSKFNLSRMELLNQLSRDICRSTPSLESVRQRLFQICRSPVYPLWSNILTYAVISAAFSAFFSGSLINMPAAALTGAVMCLLESFFFRMRLDPMFIVCACSFLGGLNNVILINLGIGFDFASISIGNIMLMIPGIVMTNAIRDIFGGDFISGTSRLAQSMLLAFLVAFGFTCAGLLISKEPSPMIPLGLLQIITGGIGALGFSLLFNIRGRKLIPAALGGSLGWAVCVVLAPFVPSEAVRYLISTMILTFCAEWMARHDRCPATVFLTPASIPLIPGASLYYTLSFAMQKEWSLFFYKGIDTLLLMIAMSAGILIAMTLLRIFWTLRGTRNR